MCAIELARAFYRSSTGCAGKCGIPELAFHRGLTNTSSLRFPPAFDLLHQCFGTMAVNPAPEVQCRPFQFVSTIIDHDCQIHQFGVTPTRVGFRSDQLIQ